MTPDQLAKWIATGEDAPTVDEARVELIAASGIIHAMITAIDGLANETIVKAEETIGDMHYRAERASEYALLSAMAQRLRDITMIAGNAAQR